MHADINRKARQNIVKLFISDVHRVWLQCLLYTVSKFPSVVDVYQIKSNQIFIFLFITIQPYISNICTKKTSKTPFCNIYRTICSGWQNDTTIDYKYRPGIIYQERATVDCWASLYNIHKPVLELCVLVNDKFLFSNVCLFMRYFWN